MPRTILFVGAPSFRHVAEHAQEAAPAPLQGHGDTSVIIDSFSAPNLTATPAAFKTPIRAPSSGYDGRLTGAHGPEWRVIRPKQALLTTGLTQDAWEPRSALAASVRSRWRRSFPHDELSFLTLTATSSGGTNASQVDSGDESEGEDLTRSFALHENLASSQLAGVDLADAPVPSTAPSENPLRPASPPPQNTTRKRRRHTPQQQPRSPTPASPKAQRPRRPPADTATATLSSLPSATEIRQMQPQTMRVDLVVGVIAKQAARTVTVARTGARVDLLEVLVGDDTRAGLGVTFWLAAPPDHHGAELRAALAALRAGDVVLLRCVALTQFRGVVYAQSLGWRWWRRTGVALLWRRGLAAAVAGGAGEPIYDSDGLDAGARADEGRLVGRVRAVRRWVEAVVVAPPPPGADGSGRGGVTTRSMARGRAVVDDALPPDESQG